MKNVHKIRGKREFLFDDRELLVLGSLSMVICVLIFFLGLLVGQGMEQHTLAQTMDFTASPVTDAVETARDADAPAMFDSQEPLPESTPSKKSGGSYFTVLPDREEYVEVEATPVEGTVPQATVLSEDVPEPVATQPAAAAPAAQTSGSGATVTRQNTAVAPVLPNVPRSPTDEMRVGRPAATGVDEGAALAGIIYSVQVASSPNYADSERLQQKLVALGFETLIMTADLGAKGVWYRVRVGNLPTKDAAEQMRQEILGRASHLAKDPYVIKLGE